jgi:hypothetical protein
LTTATFTMLYAVVMYMAIGACFLPFLLLISKRMRQVKTFRIVGFYWLLTGLINLVDLDFFSFFTNIAGMKERLNLYDDLLDSPLALLLFAAAVTGRRRKQILLVLLLFIAGELTLVGIKGYNTNISFIIVGTGMVLAIIYSITGLLRYMRQMEHTPFENSMVYVYSALIFAYGSYLILYIFSLIRASSSHGSNKDSNLVYFISMLLSASITSIGLWSYGIRRPQAAV